MIIIFSSDKPGEAPTVRAGREIKDFFLKSMLAESVCCPLIFALCGCRCSVCVGVCVCVRACVRVWLCSLTLPLLLSFLLYVSV